MPQGRSADMGIVGLTEIDEALADSEWDSRLTPLCSALVVTERVQPEPAFVEEEVVWSAVDTLDKLFDGLYSRTYWGDHSDEHYHYGYVFLWE